jgi:signal peptidase II
MIKDLILFTVVVTADRVTKFIVPQLMELHQSIPVIPNLFSFTYLRNTGGAFGILAGWDSPFRRGFFIVASIAALALLIFLYRQAVSDSSLILRLSFVLIGAGALGNLYDRAVTGEVIDFIDFYIGSWHYPAFNVADSAITVGAIILAYAYLGKGADFPGERKEPDVP